jgi:hypothetical protein
MYDIKSGINFPKMAIKEFNRNETGSVRPPPFLYHTVMYLRDCIADQDRMEKGQSIFPYESTYDINDKHHSFLDVFDFMWGRCRAVEKDFRINAAIANIYDIRATEEITRFFIIAFHDGFNIRTFDEQFLKYCKDMLKDSLERLRQAYDQVRNMQRIKKIPKDEADEMVKN